MSLSKITTLILTSCFLVLTAFMWLLFDMYLLKEFNAIEEGKIKQNLERYRAAFQNNIDDLTIKLIDWAQWDDTYTFIDDKNSKYIESVINYETLSPMRIGHILYFRLDNKYLTGWEIDYENATLREIPKNNAPFTDSIAAVLPKSFDSISQRFNGYVTFENQTYIVCGIPIVDSKREKPIKGTLIFTQKISLELIQSINQQTKVNAEIFFINADTLGKEDALALNEIKKQNKDFIFHQSEGVALGYLLINNNKGQPFILIKIPQVRSIHLQGKKTKDFLLGSFLIATLIVLTASILFLRIKILERMERLNVQMTDIATTADSKKRVELSGKDELGILTTNINTMLSALDEARNAMEIAKDEAVRANLAKTTFIAKVSHELRTPIHSITGMNRILLKEISSQSCRSYLNMAQESAYSLLRTINDILDFSKAESGNLLFENIEFDLRESFREVIRTISPRFAEKEELELLCNVNSDVPEVIIGDPTRFKQIFVNLLGNAVKFTKKGYVKIQAINKNIENDKASLRFIIEDTGIGIAEDKLKDIFEPFKQADDSITRNFQGTGLGLTIVKQFVETMGGTIWVESILEKGTQFIFDIQFGFVVSESSFKIPDSNNNKTLIIDRSSSLGREVQAMLTSYNLSVKVLDADEVQYYKGFFHYNFVIVTYAALQHPDVYTTIIELSKSNIPLKPKLIVLVPHQQIKLRETLNLLRYPLLVTCPLINDDLLLAAFGDDKKQKEASDEIVEIRKARQTLTILIADDTLTNRIILEKMLLDLNHKVVVVNNGLELLDAYNESIKSQKKSSYDLIFTDVQMPLMDGLTATRRIREIEKHEHIQPICIFTVTAHVMPNEKQAMIEIGVNDILEKPIYPNKLTLLLDKVIEESTTERNRRCSIDDKMNTLQSGLPEAESSPCQTLNTNGVEEKKKYTQIIQSEELLFSTINESFYSLQKDEELIFLREMGLRDFFDLNSLYVRCGGSVEHINSLLIIFLNSFEKSLENIKKAYTIKDTEVLRFEIHHLKGILNDIGAVDAGKVAGILEQVCIDKELSKADALIHSLCIRTTSVARLIEAIKV
jgi:signal transduction histidine kinase/CheY-like chemotaxis protein/HPt (histidine-containing phosphotransfer) domain-containing protein